MFTGMSERRRARAAVQYGYGEPLVIQTVDIDPPAPGEVLVRMAATGVCHSDLHALSGVHRYPLPCVLGHEGAGVVEEVGDGVTHVVPGDHVMLSWLPYCGECRMCMTGRPALCENVAWAEAGTMPDGTVRISRKGVPIHHFTGQSFFSELSVVPAQTVIPVDKSLSLVELSILGCAVMTGFGAVVNTAQVRAGQSVAVVGCGGVGLNVVQSAALAGARSVIAVDAAETALDMSRQMGATHTVHATAGVDVVTAVANISGGGVDHVFEAVGSPRTIELAVQLTGRGGQTTLIGMAPEGALAQFDPLTLLMDERKIVGSWYGSTRPMVDFPILLDLYAQGKLRVSPLIRRISLEEINDAFKLLETGGSARSVVVFDS